jgi:serine/threonine protein kinase
VVDQTSAVTFTNTVRGTTRWMAPELLFYDESLEGGGRPTIASDVYACAMVVYEVIFEPLFVRCLLMDFICLGVQRAYSIP